MAETIPHIVAPDDPDLESFGRSSLREGQLLVRVTDRGERREGRLRQPVAGEDPLAPELAPDTLVQLRRLRSGTRDRDAHAREEPLAMLALVLEEQLRDRGSATRDRKPVSRE